MRVIIPIVEIEQDEAFIEALRTCACAVCQSLRAERESGHSDLLIHLKDTGHPMVQTVSRRRPLARPARMGVQSHQSHSK